MDPQNILLFSCPQIEQVAFEMMTLRGGKGILEKGTIDWNHFPDGTPNFQVLDSARLKDRDVAFLACFDSMGAAMEQLLTIASIARRHALRSLKIILPYYPTGTKDRWEEPGEVVTSLELARMMQFIPRPEASRVELVTYDIHALQEESFFPDNIRVSLQSAIPELLEHLRGLENIAIAFPDEGAGKRFKQYFKNYPLIYCDKRREHHKRSVWIREGDPRGKHVFIVDDLILSGGTAIAAKGSLIEAGALEVSLFATHGVFPNESWKQVAEAGFSEVWISDSCPMMASVIRGQKPFKIVSLAPILTDLLAQEFSVVRR
ncbi:MAG: ribose-phosphate diphosphokinase [Candidatus Doudnabacteria bacterium]|nr:ribose-phosphate diphosphokinase [Candidatus Doudnabacteria bacterium]